LRSLTVLCCAALAASQAWAGLLIVPTFDSSITSDPNSANIQAAINAAIAIYAADFSDPIQINITFGEMASGLGQSTKTIYNLSYTSFHNGLLGDAKSSDDATALANSATISGGNNPVTGTSNIAVSTANIKALGIAGSFPSVLACGSTCDGFIQLNTNITFPGSPGTSSQYSLQVVAEHEIDEVLGLGSSLPTPVFAGSPSPEDLFRYGSTPGARSFTTSSSALAFFSIDGTVKLAQFDNQNDGGDFGDWQSNPLPGGVQPKVQDAFATAGATPALGVELRALDVIGYDLAVPEPATFLLFSGALAGLLGVKRATRRRV